jgi:RNA polymerase sigma factor (sigma-70 family)
MGTQETPIREQQHQALLDVIERLPEQERTVILHRFGLDRAAKTHAEIADRMGISEDEVRELEARALGKMAQRKEELRDLLS